jgi:hypothetical protein
MEAKQKAKDVIDKFTLVGLQQRNEGIQCALIAVDEILLTLYEFHYDSESGAYEYWKEVKQEIEKL